MTSAELVTKPYYERFAGGASDRSCLVMVHGSSQHGGVFSAQVEWFRDRCPLLLIDLPGHGRSGGPYGVYEYAQSVLSALDDASVGQFHYWGTHTGAAVGLLLAAQIPGRLKSMILEGAVLPGVETPSVAAAVARVREITLSKGIEAARHDWFTQAAFFDGVRRRPKQCRAEEHWAMISGFAGGPWSDASVPRPVTSIMDRLGDLRTPTLLINGEHDITDFVTIADTLHRRLPTVERLVVADAGGLATSR